MNKSFLIAIAIALLAIAGCGGRGGEEIANVNGESITTEDIHKHLETKMNFTVIVENGGMTNVNVAWTPAFQALLDLVSRKMITQMAKDEKVYPSEADLNKELEFQKKMDPQFVANRTSIGMNLKQIKDQLATQLSQERLVTKGVEVTMDEALQHIKDNPEQFTNPEELKLYYIRVSTPEARKKVETDLGIGKQFSSVAMSYSEAPSVREDHGEMNPGRKTYTRDLAPELKTHIVKTPEKKHTAWIKVADAWLMFYVDRRIPAKKMPLDDLLKERVQRSLRVQKGQLAVDIQKRLIERMTKEGPDYKITGPLKMMWDRYMTEVKRSGSKVGGAAQ